MLPSPGEGGGASSDFAERVGGLLFAVARPLAPSHLLRAARWQEELRTLGVNVPLFALHDLGLAFAGPPGPPSAEPHPGLGATVTADIAARHAEYTDLVREVAAGDTATVARTLRLGDAMITIVLARLLRSLECGAAAGGSLTALAPLSSHAALALDLDVRLPALFRSVDRRADTAALDRLAAARLVLCTIADTIDLDTLRLVGMLGPSALVAGALARVDMLAALSSAAARDIVRFSLELIPTVLETRAKRTAGTTAEGGYSGLGGRGSLESMLPTELAWTDDELARRLLDHEALYFSREQPPQPPPREHLLLIDASASMRGDRETFARGLAMALAKKLTLAGEAVRVRFFDSRLRDTGQTRPGEIPVVQILAFKGERGRNPARVFRALAAEVTAVAARERRAPAVHLITHAALQVPRPLVADVAKVAELHAVFILPNGGQLSLDYLDLLTSHVVVDHSLWKQRPGRAVAAAKIVSMLQCPFRRSSS